MQKTVDDGFILFFLARNDETLFCNNEYLFRFLLQLISGFYNLVSIIYL